ncbi:MAG: putative Ribonuclease [Candidatus Saccharibacteria bacterium]|nr:putative Ribonuclease [Candidatus Saccharibacteria bacterium]
MISRAHRFHGRGSLRYVYQRGQTVRGDSIQLRYVRNDRRKDFRAAIVVSRKVHKSAVVRNRIRRRLYAVLQAQPDLQVTPVDIVVTVFDSRFATMPAPELVKSMQNLLAQTRPTSL